MKHFLFITMILGMFLIISCTISEPQVAVPIEYCIGNYAEFQFNSRLISTEYSPGGGGIITPDGESCGINGVLDEASNSLVLTILKGGQNLTLQFEIANLNEQGGFIYVRYTNDHVTTVFDELSADYQNYVLIEEFNDTENNIKGVFDFKAVNGIGDTVLINEGVFECTFYRF